MEHTERTMATVTAAEFQRNVVLYQDKAQHEPVTVTENGREQVVLLSAEEYRRLNRRDRRVFSVAARDCDADARGLARCGLRSGCADDPRAPRRDVEGDCGAGAIVRDVCR